MLLNKGFLQKLRTGFFVLERSVFCFFSRVSELIQMRQRSPWLWNDTLYGLLPSGREHKRCLKILHDFTNKVVTINNNNDNNRNDDDDDDDDIYDLMCVRDLASKCFCIFSKKLHSVFLFIRKVGTDIFVEGSIDPDRK